MDFIQPVMTSSVARPRRSSKALPQTKLAPKKSGLGHWWSPASLIHSSFLNPGKTTVSEKCAQQMSEMHGKLLHLQSALGNKRAQFFSMTAPTTRHKTKASEAGPQGSPALFDLSPIDYHIFKHLDSFL